MAESLGIIIISQNYSVKLS